MINDDFKTENISKEAFLAQFDDKAEEMYITVKQIWRKGYNHFPTFEKESLADITFWCLWGEPNAGRLYWFCKRKILGYPYPPHFKRGQIFKARVRKSERFPRKYYLEEVIDLHVDVAHDKGIYECEVAKAYKDWEEQLDEVLIYNVKKETIGEGLTPECPVRQALCYFSAIQEGTNAPRMANGYLHVIYDNQRHQANKGMILKARTVYRMKVHYSKDGSLNDLLLDSIIEEGVKNDELKTLGKEALENSVWKVEGIGEFAINRKDDELAARGVIKLDTANMKEKIDIRMECDEENPKTVNGSTAILKKICADYCAFRSRVFQVVADDLADEYGIIKTWEDTPRKITRDDLIANMTIDSMEIDPTGADIYGGLNELFSDHGFEAHMDAEGNVTSDGLCG